MVLLCKRCHAEAPNVLDPEIMWDWIRAYRVPFYDTFWIIQGMKEYERIYGISFADEMGGLIQSEGKKDRAEMEAAMASAVQEVLGKATFHYGQPYFNTATIAGLLRMMVKKAIEQRVDMAEVKIT